VEITRSSRNCLLVIAKTKAEGEAVMNNYCGIGKSLRVVIAAALITTSTAIPRTASAFANDLHPIFLLNWFHTLLLPIYMVNLQHRQHSVFAANQPSILTMNQGYTGITHHQAVSDSFMGLNENANSNSYSVTGTDSKAVTGALSQVQVQGKGIDGKQAVMNIALPLVHNNDMAFGVLVGGGESEVKWDRFQGDMDSDIARAGVFLAMTPYPDTRLEFDYTFTRMDTNFDLLGSSGTFDSDVHDLRAQISKRFDQGNYWIETAAGLHYGQARRGGFVDTLWSENTPRDTTELFRVSGSLAVVAPISSGVVYVKAMAFHDNFGSVPRDPTFPVDARPDEDYLGFAGAVGANISVTDNVSIGGMFTGFKGGDLDGHEVMAFVNIGL
jgi:hypothetical protein